MDTTDTPTMDVINDAITSLLLMFAPDDDMEAVDRHADNLTHDVWAVCQALINRRELAIAEAQFEAEGGRGVDLADHIDRLRTKRWLLLRIPMLLNPAETEPLPQRLGDALLDNLGDDWWTRDDGDTSFCLDPNPDYPATAEVL